MRGVLRAIYLLSLAVWVGTLVFFSFAATPAIFATLPRDEAARAVAALFPVYYATGWIAGGLALAATLGLAALARAFGREARWRAVVLAGMLALSAYAGLVVLPQVRAARAAGDMAARDAGHRLSLLLNLAVVSGGIGLVVLSAVEHRKDSALRRSAIVPGDRSV